MRLKVRYYLDLCEVLLHHDQGHVTSHAFNCPDKGQCCRLFQIHFQMRNLEREKNTLDIINTNLQNQNYNKVNQIKLV